MISGPKAREAKDFKNVLTVAWSELAEGTIENVIGDQLQHSLPMQQSKKMDQFKWTLNLQEWSGIGNQIRLQGEIDIKTPNKPKKK